MDERTVADQHGAVVVRLILRRSMHVVLKGCQHLWVTGDYNTGDDQRAMVRAMIRRITTLQG